MVNFSDQTRTGAFMAVWSVTCILWFPGTFESFWWSWLPPILGIQKASPIPSTNLASPWLTSVIRREMVLSCLTCWTHRTSCELGLGIAVKVRNDQIIIMARNQPSKIQYSPLFYYRNARELPENQLQGSMAPLFPRCINMMGLKMVYVSFLSATICIENVN